MNKCELEAVINDALNEAELQSSEIPAIDLYVDQIINLVAEKQREGSERFLEKQLTKTMINNYSKDGVITPVKGKKYTKEQIIQILTVYTLKSTLSIGEIKRILAGAYAIDGFDGKSLETLYSRYMDIKEDNRAYACEIIDGMISAHSLDIERDEDFLVALGGIVSMSAGLKNIAQAMIDAKYPEVSAREKEEAERIEKEREREAEKEREKEEKERKKRERELEKQNETEKKKAKKTEE